MNDRLRSTIMIAAPALIIPVLGVTSGFAAQAGVDGWYKTLTLSSLTPPDWTFGVVWSVLYILIGLSFGFLLTTSQGCDEKQKRDLASVFILQLVVNLSWSFVFFKLHMLWAATVWLATLGALVLLLIVHMWRVRRVAAALLIPYAAWLSFAFYLSLTTAQLNP